MGGHQERARSATGGTATPQDRQSSVVGGLSPSPANHGVCGARGRPWGSLDPPRLCPGCAAWWVTQLGDPGRLNPPDVSGLKALLLSTSRYGENAQTRRTCRSSLPHPQPCSRFPPFWCCLPHARDMDGGGAGMLSGSPPIQLTCEGGGEAAKLCHVAVHGTLEPTLQLMADEITAQREGEHHPNTNPPPSQPRSSAQSALSALRTPPDCPIPTQGSPSPLVPRAEQQCGEQVEVEPDQGAHGQHQQHHAQNVSCTEGGWAYGQLGTPPAQRTRPSSPVQMEGCTPCPAPLTRHGRGE